LNGDWGWGLGIGDWGLVIGPNPQSPIYFFNFYLFLNKKKKIKKNSK
jgi:hypothetical protein